MSKFNNFFTENIKSFFNDTITYALVNIINKSIPFLLLPILIRLIDKSDYGFYSLFVTTENFLLPIISLNLYAALSKHYYLKIDLSKYISTILNFSLIILFLILFLVICIPPSFIISSGFTKSIVFVVIINSSILGIYNLIKSLFRLQRKPIHYGIYTIIFSFTLISCLLIFGYFWRNSEMLIFGRFLCYMILLIVSIILLMKLKLMSFKFNFYMLKRILKFSTPTIIFSLSAIIFTSSDRFFIQHFLGLESVGSYVAIFQISSIVTMIGISLNAAWIPWLFENLNKKNKVVNGDIVRLTYVLTVCFLLFGIIFSLIFPTLASLVLTEDYMSNLNIAYPLIFGFIFQGLYFLYSPYIFYTENTMSNGIMGLITAIINIIMNIILIPIYGIIGAAYSSMACWIILTIMAIYLSNKFYKMPWFNFHKINL